MIIVYNREVSKALKSGMHIDRAKIKIEAGKYIYVFGSSDFSQTLKKKRKLRDW